MAKIQAVWAIDIGQAAFKAVKLVPGESAEQVVAEAFDFIEYPKILSQPDADPDELVREALATFTDRNDVKGCRVAIAVPGQSGLVKFIKLPPVEKKRIPDIVKFEAKQQIPFALDEVVWAYQQVGDDPDAGDEDFTMAEVGLFAMKRDQINRAILPFVVAGIEVDVVQMSPIAIYNFIAFDQLKGSGSKDSVVLLDIGADNTDLIITDGTRVWQRNVPIGGNHFTRSLTKELKLTFAKAEHLKRNATKAADPRSIFTAMRGVFNDFASEVNRSIGFYSSINRNAKIRKIVGLGNGFKLPGLQKFLQQNLNQEVSRLEGFERMLGDEVKSAPQFQDNLASFAVAYGLGVQGLSRGGFGTNLLPPEIQRIRLVRAKKPWALAASALIMFGLTLLFSLGDYRVLRAVSTPQFKSAVEQAKNVSKRGADLKTAFEKAKGEWEAENKQGNALVSDPSERAMWPQFLKVISRYFPDPIHDYGLNEDAPDDQGDIEKLRVHIDAIKPVWRNDLKTEWFDDLDPTFKRLMHPYDANKNPPTGGGWVIQLVCHHYNPYPDAKTKEGREQQAMPVDDPARTDFGPYQFLTEKVLRKLNSPSLRLFGVDHIALAWMAEDKEWTSEKGSLQNNLASSTVPLLERATSKGAQGAAGAKSSVAGRPGGGPMSRGMPGGSAIVRRPIGIGPMANRMVDAETKSKVKTLTRTDFLLQFVWKPPKQAELPKNEEEHKVKINELITKMSDAQKNSPAVTIPKSEELEAASLKKSEEVDSQLEKALSPGGPTAPPAFGPRPPGAAPGGLPKTGAIQPRGT